MSTRIEMRNGKLCRVTESTSLVTGLKGEFIQPLEDGIQNEAIHNLPTDDTGQPIARFDYSQQEADALDPLPQPLFNFGNEQKPPEAETDADGVPILPTPKMNFAKQSQGGKAKTVANDSDVDDGLPVLKSPGFGA